MSDQIATAFSRKYAAGIELLAQQFPSILESTVRTEPGEGEAIFLDQIGTVRMQEKTGSAVNIPVVNTPHARRMITPRDGYMRDFIDAFDRLKVFNDPQNAYTEAFNAAGQRRKDKQIVDAFFGTAFTGKQGATPVNFLAANQIAAAATGFTFAKVQTGVQLLRKNNAIMRGEPVTLVYTSFQEKEFLNVPEVKSFDYNTMKALVEGEAGTFYTVKFVRLEDEDATVEGRMLPYNVGATTRSCMLYAKNGLALAKWKDVYGRIAWLDERESYQVMAGLSAGASRMQETKCVQIDCIE